MELAGTRRDRADGIVRESLTGSVLNRNRHTQEGCRNRSLIRDSTLVLTGEQILKLFLQFSRFAILFRSIESIHRRPVVFSQFIHEGSGRSKKVEGKAVAFE